MNVYWGDQLLAATPLIGGTDGNWQTFSAQLNASGAMTELRFESVGPASSPTYGAFVDNVSVTAAVPEPAELLMCLPILHPFPKE